MKIKCDSKLNYVSTIYHSKVTIYKLCNFYQKHSNLTNEINACIIQNLCVSFQ